MKFPIVLLCLASAAGSALAVDHTRSVGEPYALAGKRLVFTNWYYIRPGQIDWKDDAGKSVHDGFKDSDRYSYVDLNRSGTPLIEIVSEPDMRSSDEAYAFLTELKQVLQYIAVSTCDMEKGHLRCDANVSVRLRGTDRLGTRTELKNINSFRFVQHAVDHEIARQLRLVDGGGRVEQETRLWDADAGQSAPLRTKEEANDYRYFPDPDLPPLVVGADLMGGILKSLPELPVARYQRYQSEHALSADDARTMVSERALADYFDAACAAHPGAGSGKTLANWILTELLGALNADGKSIAETPVPPRMLSELVQLIEDGTISGKIGKDVFEECYRTGAAPAAVVEAKGLKQISDEATLGPIVDQIVTANPKQAEGYAAGKDGLFGFFVGQVMKATQGRANPNVTTALLKKRLGR